MPHANPLSPGNPFHRYLLTAVLIISLLPAATLSQARLIPHTGQTQCYDNEKQIPCPRPGQPFYGQDGNYITNPRSYTKLGYGGVELPVTARHVDAGGPWIMNRDNVTGLMWELKRNKDGTANYADSHDADNTYTWYNPMDMDDPGEPGDGNHMQAFIDALNNSRFGGYANWRIPSPRELASLLNTGRLEPAIDAGWFPNTNLNVDGGTYWTAHTDANYMKNAWFIHFINGHVGSYYSKKASYYLRAVRGSNPNIESFDNFIVNEDGTVTDTNTGLTWQKETAPGLYTWQEALHYAENLNLSGYSDWRLPNRNELQTLVDYSRFYPTINSIFKEDTKSAGYWSATPHIHTHVAWRVYFNNGFVDDFGDYGDGDYGDVIGFEQGSIYKTDSHYVRAVRTNQSNIASFGSLIISIEPETARNADTRWRRAGASTWFKHNDLETGVPPGEYRIEFSSLDDWETPEGVTVFLQAGQRTKRTATYIRQAPTDSRRAAIVVLPRGSGEWDIPGIRFMAMHAWKTLRERDYRRDEIYLLAYTPYIDTAEFNIGYDDIVNAPVTLHDSGAPRRDITVEDVQRAFAWAADKGRLDEPLLFKFVGHGFQNEAALYLDPMTLLYGEDLGRMMHDYQRAAGNAVVAMIEACYSGALLPILAGANRVIITSAGADHQARFLDSGRGSFTRLLFSELRIGQNWLDAFEKARRELKLLDPRLFEPQYPHLDDNGDGRYDAYDGKLASQLTLNSGVALTPPVELISLTAGRSVTFGENLELQVDVGPGAQRVWAVMVTPETVLHRENKGYPLKPAPEAPLTRRQDSSTWVGAFNGFAHRGDYTLTFYARDRNGFISNSTPVVFTLTNAPEATAAPVPFRSLYRPGDQVRMRIPFTPEDHRALVALSVPDIAELLILQDLNAVAPFDGETLPLWRSSDSLVLDLPVAAGLPEGIYTAFLLHVPVGVEQVDALSGAAWRLGQSTFEITYRED